MKIIKIEKCAACKWHDFGWCYHPSFSSERVIHELAKFPKWCPLEDANNHKTIDLGVPCNACGSTDRWICECQLEGK